MPNILTAAEAANFIRTDATDAVMLMLLPQVDAIIKRATGRDWTTDSTINPVAKAAAGMLLVQYYENPSQMGTDMPLAFGLQNALAQLEAEALKYRRFMFYGSNGAGAIYVDGARVGDDVISLVGLYGATGDQSSKFESEISADYYLQQTSADDLSENIYAVTIKSPIDDV
jgi:hypothetical protein